MINLKIIFYEEKKMQDILIDFRLNDKDYNKNSIDPSFSVLFFQKGFFILELFFL